MIRHIVLVRFRSDVSGDEIRSIFADLDALRTTIPGFLTFAGGASVSPEGLGRGYGHAFTADFRDEATRDAYLAHPAHKAAGARLVGAAEGGRDGLVVVDLPL